MKRLRCQLVCLMVTYILSDKETFDDSFEQLWKDDRDKITDHFMTITNKIKLEELRF